MKKLFSSLLIFLLLTSSTFAEFQYETLIIKSKQESYIKAIDSLFPQFENTVTKYNKVKKTAVVKSVISSLDRMMLKEKKDANKFILAYLRYLLNKLLEEIETGDTQKVVSETIESGSRENESSNNIITSTGGISGIVRESTQSELENLQGGGGGSANHGASTPGGNGGSGTNNPIIKEHAAIKSITADSTPVYIFESSDEGTIIYGGNCSSPDIEAKKGINLIEMNNLSDGSYSNCNIKVISKDDRHSNILQIPTFTVNAPNFEKNFSHINTWGPDYDYGVVFPGGNKVNEEEAEWLATHHDLIVGLSRRSGKFQYGFLNESQYEAIKKYNENVMFAPYFSYVDYTIGKENALIDWFVNNGYDEEEMYYHLYEDTIISTRQGDRFVKGYGGGTATSLKEARIPDSWHPDTVSAICLSCDKVKEATIETMKTMITVNEEKGYFADGLMRDSFDGGYDGSFYPELHKTIEYREKGINSKEEAMVFKAKNQIDFRNTLEKYLSSYAARDFHIAGNIAELNGVFKNYSQVGADVFDHTYNEVTVEYFDRKNLTTLGALKLAYNEMQKGVYFYGIADTSRSTKERNPSDPDDDLDEETWHNFNQHNLATFYLVNNPYLYASHHLGSGVSYGAKNGSHKNSHWYPTYEYDIGKPIVSGITDYWGEEGTDRFFMYHEESKTSKIIGREYEKALVLARFSDVRGETVGQGLPAGKIGENKITVNLNGEYRLLLEDNTLGPVITEISLGYSEGAILVKNNTEIPEIKPKVDILIPIKNPTHDSTPVLMFKSNVEGTISYSGECNAQTTKVKKGENLIEFNQLSDGTYNNCKIVVTDKNGISSNEISIGNFTLISPDEKTNYNHIKTGGYDYDYAAFKNTPGEAKWLATHHDMIMGLSPRRGKFTNGMMSEEEYLSLKQYNPNVQLVPYFSFTDFQIESENPLLKWGENNGYDLEDFYYHLYKDTTVNTRKGERFVKGYGEGSATTIEESRIPDSWHPDTVDFSCMTCEPFQKGVAQMLRQMVTVNEEKGYFADGIIWDSFGAFAVDKTYFAPLENTIEFKKEGITTREEASQYAADQVVEFRNNLEKYLSAVTGKDFHIYGNVSEMSYIFDTQSQITIDKFDHTYNEINTEYFDRRDIYTLPYYKELYDLMEQGLIFVGNSDTSHNTRFGGGSDRTLTENEWLSLNQHIVATGYLLNHKNLYVLHHLGSGASYGAVNGSHKNSHWYPNYEYDIGKPIVSGVTDYWGEVGTDRFFVYKDISKLDKVLGREYENALVLARFVEGRGWNNVGKYKNTIELNGNYRRLQANNTLGPIITSIDLGYSEGAILIKAD